jgi:hypothetical protein
MKTYLYIGKEHMNVMLKRNSEKVVVKPFEVVVSDNDLDKNLFVENDITNLKEMENKIASHKVQLTDTNKRLELEYQCFDRICKENKESIKKTYSKQISAIEGAITAYTRIVDALKQTVGEIPTPVHPIIRSTTQPTVETVQVEPQGEIEVARAEYIEKFKTDVPNRFKNDIEWLNKKLAE